MLCSSRLDYVATHLLEELQDKLLNIITVESATGGKIVSSLIDIPFYGRHIYGGIVTCDTDAKRFIIGVRHDDVYTVTSSKEMAIEALENSRALSALSITGYAAPVPFDTLDKLGMADIAFAIRTKTNMLHNDDHARYSVFHKKFNFCDDTESISLVKLCSNYKDQSYQYGKVEEDLIKTLRNELRQEMAVAAMEFATEVLQDLLCLDIDYNGIVHYFELDKLCTRDYDALYAHEPSYLIDANINYTHHCELH